MAHKTTGYGLREAIKQHTLRRDTAASMFSGSLKAFPDEKKDAPSDVATVFLNAENAIARLQTAQMRYNLAVTCQINGQVRPLAEAIKLVGGVARIEKMWRGAASSKEDRYGFRDEVREAGQVRAEPTVSAADAVKYATSIAKRSAALRQAIAVANATEIVIEDLDASLFE